MHEELFHSPDRPFRATPDSKFYYPHDSIETARQTIVRAVIRAEGPVMVLAGAGLGKSLLGMLVAEELANRFDVVKLHAARLCSRRALLQNILFELQLPYRELTEGDLRLSILNRLEVSSDHAPDGILMIVDEAHTLPAKLLDELRLITNFTRGNQPRVRLVLIGSLRLEDTFAEPQMESFNQRLAARCYLQPMNRQQTRDYVGHQFSIAGVTPRSMITEEALASVYAASEGVPRLVNQIMDHALVLAITRGQCPVSSALIEESWADLQQLPAPWHTGADRLATSDSRGSSHGHAVEFGELEDDEADEPLQDSSPLQPTVQKTASPAHVRQLAAADSEDVEFRLADEPTASPSAKQPTSFFAAFVSPEGELATDAEPDEVELRLQDEADTAPKNTPFADGFSVVSAESAFDSQLSAANPEELLTRPRVIFDMQQARQRARQLDQDGGYVDGDCVGERIELQFVPGPASDSFFANRPTDERMLAFEVEQREFDAMGVWENDPPLTRWAGDHVQSSAAKGKRSWTSQDLFGDDFEEEVCLTSPEIKKPSRFEFSAADATIEDAGLSCPAEQLTGTVQFIDSQAAQSIGQAAAAADYVARMQQAADEAIAGEACSPSTPECVAMEQPDSIAANIVADFSFQSAFDTWSVDVASLDVENEIAVHDEIEDLVSQLNFAAFSVEPFSVEQIEVAPRDQRPQPPHDSMRSGQRDEIYTLHRRQELSEESVFSGWTADPLLGMDDDRDLLVVEEDLPLTAKSSNEAEPPVTKIAPYSQLFAKLRK